MRVRFAILRRLAACLCVLQLGLFALAGSAAAEARLSLPEAHRITARLLDMNRPREALILAEGLLQGVPDDVPALVLKARALRDLGRMEEAQQAASDARRAAATDKDKFFAALVTAQAEASDGHNAIAQYWLRYAAQVAPEDELRAIAVRDYRIVRRSTPWRLKASLFVEPSDNLNGAPKTNEFTFAGLTFTNAAAVPLSGLRYGGKLDFTYRIATGARSRINLGARMDLERVRFSREARDRVPGIRDGDFRRDRLGFSLGYELMGAESRWIAAADLSVSRYWGGGVLISDSVRLDLGYRTRIATNWEGGLRFGFESETRHDLALRNARTRDMGVTLTRRLDMGSLTLDVSAADTRSDSRLVARQTGRATLAYSHARAIKGMKPRLSLHYEAVNYDQSPFGFWIDPREDREWGLSFDVLLPKLDYMGFAPEVGLSWRDRRSNYSLYETQGTDLRLGLRSVF